MGAAEEYSSGILSSSTAQEDAVDAEVQSHPHLLQRHDSKLVAYQQPAPPSKGGKHVKPSPRARVVRAKASS